MEVSLLPPLVFKELSKVKVYNNGDNKSERYGKEEGS